MAESAAGRAGEPRTEAAAGAGEPRAPIVVDLAKHSRKKVRKLRRGTGPLMRAAHQAFEELRAANRIEDGAQIVLLVVRQKPRRKRRLLRGLF